MKQWILAYTTCICAIPAFAQSDSSKQVYAPADSSEVVITAFGQYRTDAKALPSTHQLRGTTLDRSNKTSFLQTINTLPGVRMEERSPGSYRLNIRGSSLRSPFGVRNVKIYYNGLPFTDAGGNSYFNQLAFNNIASIEISKGPAGSMYGAGTGGLVLLHTLMPFTAATEAEISGGSYGLFQAQGTARWSAGEKIHAAGISYVQQQGYRDQTRMHKANASYSGRWIKKERYQLDFHFLLSDLFYQTPGGLTQAEYDANPQQARPRTGALPSAQENKAAIYQQNIMAGITNTWKISRNWTHETGIYGAYAGISNPSIRNYEQRKEPGWGGRTVFTQTLQKNNYRQYWTTGAEGQWGHFNTRVFTNNKGEKGNLVTNDNLDFFTWNAFTQWQRFYGDRLDLSAGISYFYNKVGITRIFPAGNNTLRQNNANDWAPRFSAIFRPSNQWQVSGLVSRGFSPPTVSELLPSTGIISTSLQPEYGWNYEAGLRWQTPDGRWSTGINGFRFDLKGALVQRRDSTGADYYTNAGGTRQQGIEWNGGWLLKRNPEDALRVIHITTAYTYSHFRYTQFKQLNTDYSGKVLPSVPAHAISVTADALWKNSFFIRGTFYAASSIWLNDANTARAKPYELLGLKLGYGKKWQFFGGVDNLLNEVFSLGNDINAFGGRYFNSAPGINFYAGIRAHWSPVKNAINPAKGR